MPGLFICLNVMEFKTGLSSFCIFLKISYTVIQAHRKCISAFYSIAYPSAELGLINPPFATNAAWSFPVIISFLLGLIKYASS